MVSLHTPHSPTRRKIIPDLENLFKKRKLNDDDDDDDDDEPDQARKIFDHHPSPIKGQTMIIKSTPDTELHLETPTPLEWQRCLDIKSGQIYFYNTRTNKRMLSEPRSTTDPPPPPPPPQSSHDHMSLDLELNLPCGSIGKNQVADIFTKNNSGCTSNFSRDNQSIINSSPTKSNNNKNGGLTRSPSWLTFEGEQEMVAAACKKCHMLVMMCKSSPSCPNCKFMHPPEQSTPNLLKPRLSLLC